MNININLVHLEPVNTQNIKHKSSSSSLHYTCINKQEYIYLEVLSWTDNFQDKIARTASPVKVIIPRTSPRITYKARCERDEWWLEPVLTEDSDSDEELGYGRITIWTWTWTWPWTQTWTWTWTSSPTFMPKNSSFVTGPYKWQRCKTLVLWNLLFVRVMIWYDD